MNIYIIVDNTPFVWWSLGHGMMGLKNYVNANIINLDKEILLPGNLNHPFEDADLLLFEIGNPQHAGWSASRLKEYFPNAKLVTFCSDTIYYQVNGLQPQLDPSLIDLHLEIMPQSIDWLKEKGAPLVDRWVWTISDELCKLANEYLMTEPAPERIYDFIGVYHPGTIANPDCWRHHAVRHLTEAGYKFTQGGGNGHEDKDIYRLMKHYRQSRCTLGTSSHNRAELTRLGCCKGFRDVLGPLLGSVLIYDDHPNILSYYPFPLPTYKYDNFESITKLYSRLFHHVNDWHRYDVLESQISWIKSNTVDKQLVRLLLKHDFIRLEDVK